MADNHSLKEGRAMRREDVRAQEVVKCPFIDPTFYIGFDEPCPVCGMTGDFSDDEDRCVDAGMIAERRLVSDEPAPASATHGTGSREAEELKP